MIANQTEANLLALITGCQPLDSDLTAIAALSTTTFGRSLLANADAAALLISAGLFAPQACDAYASGSTYNLTASSALIDFGTTDPTITIAVAGTYRISARAVLAYAGATFAPSQTITMKLRRTNNTAADLTNGGVDFATGIVTLLTAPLAQLNTPYVVYVATAGDIVSLYGLVGVAPSAGNVTVTAASIHAQRVA